MLSVFLSFGFSELFEMSNDDGDDDDYDDDYIMAENRGTANGLVVYGLQDRTAGLNKKTRPRTITSRTRCFLLLRDSAATSVRVYAGVVG